MIDENLFISLMWFCLWVLYDFAYGSYMILLIDLIWYCLYESNDELYGDKFVW